jgi:hypothetical protein
MTMTLAGRPFRRVPGQEEYVLVFRIPVEVGARRPLWVVCGQTARSNHAATRYLNTETAALARRLRGRDGFGLALRVVNPSTYDHRYVEVVAEFEPGDYTRAMAG